MPKTKAEEQKTVFLDTALTVETSQPQTVLFLLSSKDDALVVKACQALLKFARGSAENRRLLCEQDSAVHLLLNLVDHTNRDIRRLSAMCLAQLADNSTVQDSLLVESSARKLVRVLGAECDCIVTEFASNILGKLCGDAVGKANLLSYGALESMVFQLRSPDADVLKNCLSSLVELLDDIEAASRFQQSNGMSSVLPILHSDYPVLQQLTLTLLKKLMDGEDGRRSLRDAGGLNELGKLLSDPSLNDLHKPILVVLQSAVIDPLNSRELHRVGGLLTLLQILETNTSNEILSGCGECLAQMARNREIGVILYEQNVSELVAKTLLSSRNPQCQTAGAMAAGWMSQNLRSQQKLIELEAVPKIASLVENAQALQVTAQALALLTTFSQTACKQLSFNDNLKTLLDKLRPDNEEIVIHVAAIVRNLAEDLTIRDRLISSSKIVDNLCDCLKSSNPNIIISACQALTVLSVEISVRRRLIERHELGTFVDLLNSLLDTSIREEVSRLLFLVCTDAMISEQFCRHGGVECLRRLKMQRLLNIVLHYNLSALYSLRGKLERYHITSDGFFDCGRQADDKCILDIRGQLEEPLSIHKLVLLFNSGVCPAVNNIEIVEKQTPGKLKTSKEDNASHKTPLDASQLQQPHDSIQIPVDSRLKCYVEYARRAIGFSGSESQRTKQLAEFISSRLGGKFLLDQIPQLTEPEVDVDSAKHRLGTNVVPIGELQHGLFRPRAILFKFLADQLLLPCTLERGLDGRYWNCVYLETTGADGRVFDEPRVVDLIESPGTLMCCQSYEARTYTQT